MRSVRLAPFLVFPALVLCALAWWHWKAVDAERWVAQVPTQLAEARRFVYPSTFPQNAAAALAHQPLNQAYFNAYYVHQATQSGEATLTRNTRLARALAALGWRYTAAQRNLMVAAANDGRFSDVISHADALLRRDKSTDQALDILYLIESDPAARALLLPVLAKAPPWRSLFLRNHAGLNSAAKLEDREQTIAALASRGVRLQREELVPFLNRLAEAGQLDRAYKVWRRSLPFLPGEGVFDPQFRYANSLARGGGASESPFEWRFEAGNGYGAFVDGSDAGGVELRWDGRGVPIFLRQRFNAKPGYHVFVAEGPDARTDRLSLLSVTVQCPGSIIHFGKVISVRGGVRLLPDSTIDCTYPELQISAKVGSRYQRLSWTFSTLAVRRN